MQSQNKLILSKQTTLDKKCNLIQYLKESLISINPVFKYR